jgi:hypothetical protein
MRRPPRLLKPRHKAGPEAIREEKGFAEPVGRGHNASLLSQRVNVTSLPGTPRTDPS